MDVLIFLGITHGFVKTTPPKPKRHFDAKYFYSKKIYPSPKKIFVKQRFHDKDMPHFRSRRQR